MVKYDPLLLAAYKIMSQKIPKIESFYQSTACLNGEEREILGYIEAYCELFGRENSMSKRLMLFGKAIKKIGISKWLRSEWTDIGLFIGETSEKDIVFPKQEEIEIAEPKRT